MRFIMRYLTAGTRILDAASAPKVPQPTLHLP